MPDAADEKQHDVDRIRSAIRSAYVSLSDPQFLFVRRAAATQPYRGLLDDIANRFGVVDETDFNDDVGLALVLSQSVSEWLLRLSFVGRYAVLWRVSPIYDPTPLADRRSMTETEAWIAEQLRAHNVELLSKRVLEAPIDLRLSSTLPTRARVFQGLFSDRDILPWEQI